MTQRWSRPAQVLLDAGQDIEDRLALLERAHCLNQRALAERATVIALLAQTIRAFDDAASAGSLPPEQGGPWLCDAVRDTLRASGYLDELAWATLESGASPENPRVTWLIAQVREAQGRRPAAATPGGISHEYAGATGASAGPGAPASDEIVCPLCRRQLPRGAAFCGYCGHKLG